MELYIFLCLGGFVLLWFLVIIFFPKTANRMMGIRTNDPPRRTRPSHDADDEPELETIIDDENGDSWPVYRDDDDA